jgi:upstream activation factor subunit UAF30
MPKQTKSDSAPAPKQIKIEKVASEAKPAKVAAEAKPAKVAAEAKPAKVAAASPAPAAEAKPAKVSKKKEVAAPVPVVAETAVAETAVVETAATVSTDFADFMGHLQQLSTVISSLKTEFRNLEKKATRELKTAAKVSNKRKRKTGNRSPSGFVKPTLISDELATFLGKTTGTQMARTEVTREINAYIREHKLQDKTNGRRINADTKLSSLLKLTSGEELTYFNLQRYMSPHFAKNVAAVAATASA